MFYDKDIRLVHNSVSVSLDISRDLKTIVSIPLSHERSLFTLQFRLYSSLPSTVVHLEKLHCFTV